MWSDFSKRVWFEKYNCDVYARVSKNISTSENSIIQITDFLSFILQFKFTLIHNSYSEKIMQTVRVFDSRCLIIELNGNASAYLFFNIKYFEKNEKALFRKINNRTDRKKLLGTASKLVATALIVESVQ